MYWYYHSSGSHQLDREGDSVFWATQSLHRCAQASTHLTIPTKINVYKACVISTLLYGSESCTTYSTQEQKLQVFHLRCLHRILGITWQNKVQNNDALLIAGVPSMFTLLCQCCLCWLGHVRRMEDGCIPKDLLYGKLAMGPGAEAAPNYATRMYASVT